MTDETPAEDQILSEEEAIATEEPETPVVEDFEVMDDHESLEDHEGGGLAAKALGGLGLLLAGGVIALWIGPKIAPKLPSGMAPVADWLMPGAAKSRAAFDDFKMSVDARFAALPKPLDVAEARAMVDAANGGLQAEFTAQITALSDQMQAVDGVNIESRLATVESGIGGLEAELAALTGQIRDVSATGGAISADTGEKIATYGAELAGLKAQITQLAQNTGALSQKIDEVATAADRKATEAENALTAERKAAAIQSALDTINAALGDGANFGAALDVLDAEGIALPDELSAARTGVETLASLRDSYPDAARAALRAAHMNDTGGNSVLSAFGSFLGAQVATRSLTPQQGGSADAILSRAEAALSAGDLAGALGELDALAVLSLSSDANSLMESWIAAAHARLTVETAFKALVSASSPE